MRIAHVAVSALLISVLGAPEVAAKKQSAAKVPPTPAACTDFYANTNTGWLRSNPLPPGDNSRSRWNELFELSARQRESLFSQPASNAGRAQQQLNGLMLSATDEARIQADTDKTLAPLFSDIDRIKKVTDINSVIAKLHARGIPVVFAVNQGNFSANGLGMPEAGFYTGTNADLQAAQARYRSYIETMLKTGGMKADKVSAQSSLVLGIEMQLANASAATAIQTVNAKDINKLYPSLNLGDFLRTQKISNTSIVISNDNYFKALNQSINTKNIEAWKSYLRFHVSDQLAPYLSDAYYREHTQFHDVYIAGRNAVSRKEKMRALIESAAPDLIDAAYAERYIKANDKKRALEITQQIVETAKTSSANTTWLSEGNKAKTFDMLKTLRVDIGRKDADVKAAEISSSMSTNAVALLRRQSSGDSVPSGWSDSVPLMSYLPDENRILISQALLQEHMLSEDSAAVDYGAFGTLFAQQLSVAILNNLPRGSNDLAPALASITKQYNAYPLAAGKKVNGELTAIQNLADLSALELAYKTFNSSTARDKAAQQNFYKAWATVWARVDRDSALAASASRSVHAPYKLRVNGALSNISSFGATFDCKASAMQKASKDQLKIWP